MDEDAKEPKYDNIHQGIKTTYSYGYKKDDPTERYFTIEQDGNKIFLGRTEVLMLVANAVRMIDRWKVGKKIHRATGNRYK